MTTPAPPAAPTLWCDLVMKGGITSGVVYPAAVCELAQTYRFRSIGGTSAGAIAAALTAAAELGRDRPGGGFARLAELPDELARRLLTLFQPAPPTRPAFAVLVSCLGNASLPRKGLRALGAALRGHPLAAAAGLAAGWGVDRLLLRALDAHPAAGVAWALGGLVAVACALASLLAAFAVTAWRGLSGNGFGLCSGMPAKSGAAAPLPLTPWLADRIDVTAGRDPEGPPLTFGDLWGLAPDAAEKEKEAACQDPRLRRIDLAVMTSNLMHARPYAIPFLDRVFFYRQRDCERLFPPRVGTWMRAHSTPAQHAGDDPELADLRHLPHPADLPVVVAARLSLSFPLLLSAVPLYAVDYRRRRNQEARKEQRPLLYERCWFSDGGIGSNFPIHFFDGTLPGRPTFGINLRPVPPDDDGGEDGGETPAAPPPQAGDGVSFPRAPHGEVLPDWHRFRGLGGFPGAILNTMQNWVDSTQMRLPSYRDRVVHVELSRQEGGMNLDMPPARVQDLSDRGRRAGQILAQRFNWDLHRWTRLRVSMLALKRAIASMAAGLSRRPRP
jgi:predicted acylesterase/phospholipase RssA